MQIAMPAMITVTIRSEGWAGNGVCPAARISVNGATILGEYRESNCIHEHRGYLIAHMDPYA